MTALYTDIDPFCCEVLRACVEDGGLPPGEVWERDVCTIMAEEVRRFDHVHLFAGIGASPLGLAWAGWPELLSIMTGGFPCQDISTAGKGAGLDGARSGLFFEFVRLAGERRPDWLLAENVGALSARGLDRVAGALGAVGYNVYALRVGAWAVGSPQQRERWWIVANLHGAGRESGRRVQGDQEGAERGRGEPAGGDQSGAGPRTAVAEPHKVGQRTGHRGQNGQARADSGGEGRELVNPDGQRHQRPHEPLRRSQRGTPPAGASQSRQLADLRGAGQGTERGGRQRSRLEGPGPDPGQAQGAQPRYASPRRWPHVLWVDEHGEPVATPQFEWESPRLYTRGMEGLADGVPARLASALNKRGVAATGNAQVPEVVEVIGRAMLEAEALQWT